MNQWLQNEFASIVENIEWAASQEQSLPNSRTIQEEGKASGSIGPTNDSHVRNRTPHHNTIIFDTTTAQKNIQKQAVAMTPFWHRWHTMK